MRTKSIPVKEIDEIMRSWSAGMDYADISKKYNRSLKSVEAIVSRNKGYWSRAFNFPKYLKNRRFGA
tara:strand:- start:5816 stop:6016 length:201 start_codon:yes stop_codon:yes gene_type:complete